MAVWAQGDAVPGPDPGLDAEWLAPPSIYIYRETAHSVGGAAPRFTRAAPRTDGEFAIGFDAEQL